MTYRYTLVHGKGWAVWLGYSRLIAVYSSESAAQVVVNALNYHKHLEI